MENIQVVNDWIDYNLNNFLLDDNKVIINCNYKDDELSCMDKIDPDKNTLVIYKSLSSEKFESFIYFIAKNKSFKVARLSLVNNYETLNVSLYDNYDNLEIKYKLVIIDFIKKLEDELNAIYDECFKIYFKDHKTEVLIVSNTYQGIDYDLKRICDTTYDHFIILKGEYFNDYNISIYRIINGEVKFQCLFFNTSSYNKAKENIKNMIEENSPTKLSKLTKYFLNFHFDELIALLIIDKKYSLENIAIDTYTKVKEAIKEREDNIK